MSDITEKVYKEIALLPAQIITHPRYNVRPFSSECSEIEDQEIEMLAGSIEKMGQLDPALITPEHILIAGHRRRRAVLIINEKRSARGQSLLRLRCSIETSTADLRKRAIVSNLHRKETSPMDLACLIAEIRREYDWQGFAGVAKVAEYLGINTATVTQHERLNGIEKELQHKIHTKQISAQSAFDLIRVLKHPDARMKAIERAREIQEEDRTDKALEDHRSGKKSHDETIKSLNMAPRTRIEHPAIVKAIRESHTTIKAKKLALSRSELIHSISQFDSDSYPEPIRVFARYWVKVFAQGQGTAEDLIAKILAITQPPEVKSQSHQLLTPIN